MAAAGADKTGTVLFTLGMASQASRGLHCLPITLQAIPMQARQVSNQC